MGLPLANACVAVAHLRMPSLRATDGRRLIVQPGLQQINPDFVYRHSQFVKEAVYPIVGSPKTSSAMGDEAPVFSLFTCLTDIAEEDLICLTPLPSGEVACRGLYVDLFGGDAPTPPAILSEDPFVQTAAEMRSTLAHYGCLRASGAFQAHGVAGQLVYHSMYKFLELYESYSATVIQRLWRSKRPGAPAEETEKFTTALALGPTTAEVGSERATRRALIQEILAACHPPTEE
jgi:hypothetical protein